MVGKVIRHLWEHISIDVSASWSDGQGFTGKGLKVWERKWEEREREWETWQTEVLHLHLWLPCACLWTCMCHIGSEWNDKHFKSKYRSVSVQPAILLRSTVILPLCYPSFPVVAKSSLKMHRESPVRGGWEVCRRRQKEWAGNEVERWREGWGKTLCVRVCVSEFSHLDGQPARPIPLTDQPPSPYSGRVWVGGGWRVWGGWFLCWFQSRS